MSAATDIKSAEERAEQSRIRLGVALDHLRDTLQSGIQRIDGAIFRAQAPVRFVKRHPTILPTSLAVLAFIVGIVGGRRYAQARLPARELYGGAPPRLPS